MTTSADCAPWYRQGWPWFLISLPATAVAGGLITFYLAASGWDGPVAQDYYKQGLAVNAEIARSERAVGLGVTARVTLNGFAVGDRVRVEVDAAKPLSREPALRLQLVHPGRRDADRLAVLVLADAASDGRSAIYVGEWSTGDSAITGASRVIWQAVVEAREWRIDGTVTTAGAGAFELRAR